MALSQPFRFATRIRFIDTDTSGRIHYTAMFRYFESAEIEFLRLLSLHYGPTAEFAFPRVHAECDLLRPIIFDDLIEVEVFLTKLGRSSMRFEFRTRKAQELAAKGAVVIVCMDRDTQRAAPFPDDMRAQLTAVVWNGELPE